jgi:release factor glutamine methyltransferase
LDLCTGSGAVAIALKHECPGLEVWAADISEEALAIARGNAEKLLPGSIRFLQGDLFGALENAPAKDKAEGPPFSFITANPPYIPSGEISALPPEVQHEPRLALDGGADGLSLIRRIIAEAPLWLEARGTLLLEADPGQAAAICGLMEARGFNSTAVFRDLAGVDRVFAGEVP